MSLMAHGVMKVFDKVKENPEAAMGAVVTVATNPWFWGAVVVGTAAVATIVILDNKKNKDDKK